MKPIYIGAFIKEPQCVDMIVGMLPPTPGDWKQYCDHVTLLYKPSKDMVSEVWPLLGSEVVLQYSSYVQDEKCQAIPVSYGRIVNRSFALSPPSRPPVLPYYLETLFRNLFYDVKNPHVTVSCAPGIAPKYSNGMLCQKRASYSFARREFVATIGLFDGITKKPYYGESK